jgi:hypothetical protein
MSDLPIVCTLTETQLQERRETILERIRSMVREVKELPDGYSFKFAADDDELNTLMQMINLERKCCGFLRFTLTVEPESGPVWMEITGPGGAKPMIRAEFGPST